MRCHSLAAAGEAEALLVGRAREAVRGRLVDERPGQSERMADLANLVNEAALRAVRKGRQAVNQNDLLVSFELVIAGSEKKGTVITEEEKRIIAYHEVGHALVAAKQKNAQPVSKITIVPHTQGALGYTLHLPEEEKFLMSREDILAEIRTLLAGRSSEEIVCDTMTSGAANDIERATEMARNLVARFGMCEEFDMMALGSVQSQYLDGGYSMTCAQETYAAADRETIKILRQCHEEAKQILLEKEIEILVDLNAGDEGATAWGCDLTYDYVKINGDYRT